MSPLLASYRRDRWSVLFISRMKDEKRKFRFKKIINEIFFFFSNAASLMAEFGHRPDQN